jgi:hypothetical protein
VLFFGVLYHLPDMIKALAILRSGCSGQLFSGDALCCRLRCRDRGRALLSRGDPQ